MFPITCNAIGDIVTIIQLAITLAVCLSDTVGSSSEYRELTQTLHSYHTSLLTVIDVIDSDIVNFIFVSVLIPDVDACNKTMEKLMRYIEGYRALGMSSGGKWWEKVVWALRVKGKVAKLEDKFVRQCEGVRTKIVALTL